MTVNFATTLPRQTVARSLSASHMDWLYNHCESEMGFKSSHEASVAQIQGGGGAPEDHERIATHPRVLGAAKRNREILANLEAMSVDDCLVLERFHRREQSYPRDLEFHFGEYCGVVWWMYCASKKESKRKWTTERVASVLSEAVAAVEKAYRSYDAADFERRCGLCQKSSQGT